MRIRTYGLSTQKTCAPLGYWKNYDIFAYLNYYNLPIHPNYAMLGGGKYNRKNLRVAELGDIHGRQFDRGLWEMEYYPDKIRKLVSGKFT